MDNFRTKDGAPDTFFEVNPSDVTKLSGLQWLRIGVDGNLVVKGTAPGAASVTIAVTAGEYVPFGAGYVMAATTATDIVGIA